MIEFKPYLGPNSLTEGWYRWHIGNLSFAALIRSRGAGFESVTSPSFDYWTGYRVTVPEGTMYRGLTEDEAGALPPPIPYRGNAYHCIEVDGHTDVAPCPFCKTKPILDYSGQFIGAGPHRAEWWYLKCCHYIHGVGFRNYDVVKLIETWNGKLNDRSNI